LNLGNIIVEAFEFMNSLGYQSFVWIAHKTTKNIHQPVIVDLGQLSLLGWYGISNVDIFRTFHMHFDCF